MKITKVFIINIIFFLFSFKFLFASDFENWKIYATMIFAYWSAVAVIIYLPMLIRKLLKKETGYVK